MGYPRFGAVGALLLSRLCIGTAPSIESPELQLVLMVLLAEVVEVFGTKILAHCLSPILDMPVMMAHSGQG